MNEHDTSSREEKKWKKMMRQMFMSSKDEIWKGRWRNDSKRENESGIREEEMEREKRNRWPYVIPFEISFRVLSSLVYFSLYVFLSPVFEWRPS